MNELIPIFPLELVVYPGEALNLHIFEPRYRQLIHDCITAKLPFGIPSVINGQVARLGTLVKLVEISHTHPDGKLDIRTQGLKIFHLRRVIKQLPGKLYGGAFVDYPQNHSASDPARRRKMLASVKKLHQLMRVKKTFGVSPARLQSYHVAHHVGLDREQEFALLSLLHERDRLQFLQAHLDRLLPLVAGLEALKEKIRLNGHFKVLPGLKL